ncbi:MAG: hypothetical protein E7050_05680 [Lentisphaerae bacterium]|nr:hypothetical protein [Lentisphaerota bacterium]
MEITYGIVNIEEKMADQIIQCPFCQGQLSISEELIGREVQCPLCQQILMQTADYPRSCP